MVITTTAAASLTAGQSLAQTAASDRSNALFALVLLVGVFQIAVRCAGARSADALRVLFGHDRIPRRASRHC